MSIKCAVLEVEPGRTDAFGDVISRRINEFLVYAKPTRIHSTQFQIIDIGSKETPHLFAFVVVYYEASSPEEP